jgi:hypothetical protein
MKDFISVSPMKVLELSSRNGLGAGNLGVLIARAGVGKTACLIHFAFDKIFRGEKLVHVSLEEGPEKVTSYYHVIYSDLVKALNISEPDEYRMLIDRNRMILAYMNRSFDLKRLNENLKNLSDNIGFNPDTIIVDGLDFEKTERGLLEGLKRLAVAFRSEIWLSALSHRHIESVNDRGVPYPCEEFDDIFSIIILLQPTRSGVFLKLIKDHDIAEIPESGIRLDPNTFLATENINA